LETAARPTCSIAECSPEGFASPSFEEFAFIVDIFFYSDYRSRVELSLGPTEKNYKYFFSQLQTISPHYGHD
jgi:hypothetical protein